MRQHNQVISRKNLGFLLLFVVEIVFLVARLGRDYSMAGQVIDLPSDRIVPFAEESVSDGNGTFIEGYTGIFATTPWFDIPVGSYKVVVNYQNEGEDGKVSFVGSGTQYASYDEAALPASGTQVAFSFWANEPCVNTQIHFSAQLEEGQSIRIINAQLVPTHSYAYVRFLNALLVLLLLDWALLVFTRRIPLPVRGVRARYTAVALLAITAFGCVPIGLNYLTYGHDLSVHLCRIEGIKAGLLAGQFPVRMNPDLLTGYGYPFSMMYGDLLLYPSALLRIVGYSLQDTYRVYVVGITLATTLVTWYVLRRMLRSDKIALVGTALYVLSFYRLSNVFVRAAVGEYSAMLFLPVIVYGFWRIYTQQENGSAWCWLALAVGFTGVLQTHLLTTEMAGIFAVLFCVLCWKKTFTKPVFIALCKAAGAAVLWNLWFLVPLLQYIGQGVCRVGQSNGLGGVYEYAAFAAQVFMMFGSGGGYAWPISKGIADEMPATVGTVLALGLGLLLLAMLDPDVRRARPGLTRLGGWTGGFAALALWMATDLFPWKALSRYDNTLTHVLSKLQFAWRFLAPATVFLVLASCCGLLLLRGHRPALVEQMIPVLLVLTVVPAGYLMYDVTNTSERLTCQGLAAFSLVTEQTGAG
ncbi:MAG: hypothetical protein ACI4OI_00545, partial [Gemmiger sp.]